MIFYVRTGNIHVKTEADGYGEAAAKALLTIIESRIPGDPHVEEETLGALVDQLGFMTYVSTRGYEFSEWQIETSDILQMISSVDDEPQLPPPSLLKDGLIGLLKRAAR